MVAGNVNVSRTISPKFCENPRLAIMYCRRLVNAWFWREKGDLHHWFRWDLPCTDLCSSVWTHGSY